MNAPEKTSTLSDPAEAPRYAVLQQFKVEDLQHLGQADLLLAQSLAGHGDVWGVWQTTKSISPGILDPSLRNINIAQRLRDYLAKEQASGTSLEALIDEGVIHLTRLALLTRLAASGGKTVRLKPSSITSNLYQYWPKITARSIRRKAEDPDPAGLLGCLTDDDVREFRDYKVTRIELDRLDKLVAQGLWSDAPPLPDITQMTDPSGAAEARPPQPVSVPYPPIPDAYLAEIGPRVLWIVQNLAPHLLCLLEAIPVFLGTVEWSLSKKAIFNRIEEFIADHLQQHPWEAEKGVPLAPPFPLAIAVNNRGGKDVDVFEWPPRTWSHFKILSMTLQSAHLFITLLASAGRIGEVARLKRDCVDTASDGKDYLGGLTYKLSGNLFGDARQWPAPELLVQCLGQQARLAKVWHQLPRAALEEVLSEKSDDEGSLWVSIAIAGGRKWAEDPILNICAALMMLAERVGMDPKPGGKNLHPHRFRKTIGRLAGIALFNSPLVLKRLFGHKSIEMTLHYILCDQGIREEAEKVLRELRIMHCADALEEIHEAIANDAPLPGNGGPGAGRLVQTVANEQERLNKMGRVWDKGSAHDLAFLLTANGQGWRLIKENIVCSKAPGENGLCQKKRSKGEPDTSNCKPECDNRIVLMRHRRDTETMVAQYLDIARQAKEDGQVLVLAHTMENLREELESFPDLKEKFFADPAHLALLNYCEEVRV